MIENTEVIAQDQLIPSADPKRVRVQYPRGSTTLLAFDNQGRRVSSDGDADGAYQRATVLSNGNLLFLSDRPDSIPTIVLGAALIAL